MNIAIVGSGIAGIYAAHYLSKQHKVTLYEANAYLGGHTDTHNIVINDRNFAVDTGFIVFNAHNYVHFTQFLAELGVESQPSDMSFSVSDVLSGLEYNATTIDKLFCQRQNLFRPRFFRMVLDIVRFYREAPKLLDGFDNTLTLGDYLAQNRYSQAFMDDHLIPMACALWSGPPDLLKNFPVRYFVAFMANHQMLNLSERPRWRTVSGGSSMYIDAFRKQFAGELRLNTPVQTIVRHPHGVKVSTANDNLNYDRVVLACHSDQALGLLKDANVAETEILGAMSYQDNEVVLHTDASLMPKHPKAWASWNALKLDEVQARCTITYYMNLLQNLDASEPLLVTLNCTDRIDPDKILLTRHYHHPVYTPQSLAAQLRRAEINGQRHTYFAGAYWGWGFHEDGARSAQEVVDLVGQS